MAASIAVYRAGLACVLCFTARALPAKALEVPPPAYQLAAHDAGIPSAVLFAVALQESGAILLGHLVPWPWTLNIAGTPYRYASRDETCAALRRALQQVPSARVDVGLGQLNVGYQGHRVGQPCELLNPYRNLAITATILREQHDPGQDWLLAIGRYHRPAGGPLALIYEQSVHRYLARVLGDKVSTIMLESPPP
jgi:hypothetical protein